jgi:hypothetical protein
MLLRPAREAEPRWESPDSTGTCTIVRRAEVGDLAVLGRPRRQGKPNLIESFTSGWTTVESSPERPPPTVQDGCLPGRSWHPAIVA